MNYSNGFPGTAAMQNTAFIDQSCTSTWNAPHNMPPTWEPASYVNSTVSIATARRCFLMPLEKCVPALPSPTACMLLIFPLSSLTCV